ncbi:hypothetical protein EVG20_g379 [Dentipellis fragilis]|uniref:Bromodomain-containing protein n=1 Tax=Dentipellis fragilis TaxID=205917 RepID=A0A4Y9ZF69_9AGAM|nr:hypothetical protein EVG20_g379 [Dentipellis fragilis]
MHDATAPDHSLVNGATEPDSPPTDSPDTPINTQSTVAVKLSPDTTLADADAPSDPVPIKIDSIDDAPAHTPLTSDSPHHTSPPQSEDVDDVHVPEEATPVDTPQPLESDVVMEERDAPAPNEHVPDASLAAASPLAASSSTAVDSVPADTANDDDESIPPPAKRARKFSDAEQASVHAVAPPQTSADSASRASTFSAAQYKFATSTVRTLKKLKDSVPFRVPVDYVRLNIPHYPTVIKHPMDFSTIERKLASSNPAKPDPDPNNPRYHSADEFVADIRLIFSNCVTFNGPEHFVTQQGKRVEAVFDKQIKQMPANEPKPVVKKPATPPPPPPPAPVPKKVPRRPSQSVPIIRRNETENPSRPKREIHPPPPKDLPYADAPKKARRMRGSKKDGTSEQLRFCSKILDQLSRKQHQHVTMPFAEPVDWVKLQIPDYPKIIKKPMDLLTMRRKLDNGEYSSAERFRDDFKLIISNCFTYNSPGTPVNQAGIELQHLFDDKWANLPPLVASDDEDEDDEDNEEAERLRAIKVMEAEIEAMRGNIEALKGKTNGKEKKKEKKVKHPLPVASSSKALKKEPKPQPTKKKYSKKAVPISDDDALTFDQKKDLSDAISRLDGQKLEKVISIIHEGVPEIRDSQEEIELEIDTLPAAVLMKLYNFVLRPLRQPAAKRNRTSKGTGTGGLKRKSMDEDVEAEKIRVLEERMRLFEQNGGVAGTAPATTAAANDSEHSSDSSSDDDSSGSESD